MIDQTTSELPYWARPAFFEGLSTLARFQKDETGVVVINVADHYFKQVGDQMFAARVPQDMKLPKTNEWAAVSDLNLLAKKARSMLAGYTDSSN